jgi:hypothetical protein
MGKHESVEGIRDQVKTLVPSSETASPGMSDHGRAAEPTMVALAAIEALKIETAREASRIDLATDAIPSLDSPSIDPHDMPSPEIGAAPAAEQPAEEPRRRLSPFAIMVASLAGAAAAGAMLGAIVVTGIARPTPVAAGPKIGIEDVNALKEQVVQARVELAALKSSLDAGHRTASQQFTRINERVERMERTQAEPVAKLTKAVEALDRARRAEAVQSAQAAPQNGEVTGSINAPNGAKPAILEGWILRDVHRGTAFIEGRMGIIEVDQGDMIPGLGRVDAIRKENGRWVVTTSKGLIVPPK